MPSFLLKDSARSALLALVLFAVWPLLLAMGLATWRGIMMLFDQQPITAFPAGIKHGSDIYWRYNRAHANVTENVGIVAAILVGAERRGYLGLSHAPVRGVRRPRRAVPRSRQLRLVDRDVDPLQRVRDAGRGARVDRAGAGEAPLGLSSGSRLGCSARIAEPEAA